MRIAYFAQSYPPMISGTAIVAEQLAKEMAERGHYQFRGKYSIRVGRASLPIWEEIIPSL